MAFIRTIPIDEADGAVAEMYARARGEGDHVPDYATVFSLQPDVYAAWEALAASVKATMDPRRYALVTLAAARRLQSSYCALAHGRMLRDRFFDAETVTRIARDPSGTGLSEADLALMALAEQVVDDATAVSADDVQGLRDLGIDDAEISGTVMVAAARCFFSKTLDALGATPDAEYGAMEEPLRQVLTVGRDIATA